MAVTFGAAGSGNSGSGASLTPGYPAGVNSGDLLFLHVIIVSVTETASTPGGWEVFSGPDDFAGAARCYLFAKISAGGEGATQTVSFSAGNFKWARMYSFVGNDTTSVNAATEDLTVSNGATNTILMPTVDITANDSLAVSLSASDSTSATGSATGETGGDWVEAVAEYQTGIGQLQCQTADMNVGTISGGSYAGGTATIWMNYGFGINPPSGAAQNQLAWIRA